MILKRHEQRYYKKLFFSVDSVEFKVQLAPFPLNVIYKKMAAQTSRLRIAGPLIKIMYLVLDDFEKFKGDDLVEFRWGILWKLRVKREGDVFVWTLCINTAMLNILSLYKSSTFANLKCSLVWILSFFKNINDSIHRFLKNAVCIRPFNVNYTNTTQSCLTHCGT